MTRRVALIRGDGIGPEIANATVRAVEATDIAIDWKEARAGATALVECGELVPEKTLEVIGECGCALKGPLTTPVGGGFRSPNVALRQHFDLYANVRPARSLEGVKTRFTGVDLVVVRENTEGLYSGLEHWIPPKRSAAEAIAIVTRHGSERVIRFAFQYAQENGYQHVTIFHKANILKKTTGLFLEIGREIAQEFPDIELRDLIIDNACMQMVTRPEQFQVVVTTNLFGDIISDLASGLVGGLGVTASANLNLEMGLFEAVHGTAPDIAGRGAANPTALMLSGAMMLKYLGEPEAARILQRGILDVLAAGKCVTRDLGGTASTSQYTQAVIARIEELKTQKEDGSA